MLTGVWPGVDVLAFDAAKETELRVDLERRGQFMAGVTLPGATEKKEELSEAPKDPKAKGSKAAPKAAAAPKAVKRPETRNSKTAKALGGSEGGEATEQVLSLAVTGAQLPANRIAIAARNRAYQVYLEFFTQNLHEMLLEISQRLKEEVVHNRNWKKRVEYF